MSHRLLAIALFVALGVTSASAHAPAPTRDTIRFDYDHDYIYVDGSINDSIRGRFIFDTGAGTMLLDSSLLARHGFSPHRSVTARLAGTGSNPVHADCILDKMTYKVGSYKRTLNQTIAYDFHTLVPGDWVDGILGIPYMSDTIFAIDYQHKIITFPSDQEVASLKGYSRIPFVLNGGLIEIPANIILDLRTSRKLRSHLHLDTGNPGSIDLTPTSRRCSLLLNKLPQRLAYDVAVSGFGGGARYHLFKAEKFKMGDQYIPIYGAQIIEGSASGKSKITGGIIGNTILERFHVIIDMKNRALYLKRNEFGRDYVPLNLTGLYFSKVGDRTFVNGLSHHPTQFRVGDLVTHIDGRPMTDITKAAFLRITSTPDLAYTLRVVRGDETLEIKQTNLNRDTLWQ